MAKAAKPAPSEEPIESTGPVFAADAGAALQKDRSGSPRGRELTEGQANFASFSATIQASAQEAE